MFDFIAVYIRQLSDGFYSLITQLDFSLAFGDDLLSLLLQVIYAFSVSFVFVLPFLIVWTVIKTLVK